jgi:hypothetical protein
MHKRLIHMLRFQGVLSTSEANSVIVGHRAGDNYICEAVAHYGGARKLIRDARRQWRIWLSFNRGIDLRKAGNTETTP